jgi:signal transduction histidine kinase
MKPQNRRACWWFAAVGAVMLVGLSWLTATLLRLDADERQARRQAHVQERLRLALWRMDSWLSPQLAREAMRPPEDYRAYPAASTVWTKGFNRIEANEVLVQSPLLGRDAVLFDLHFEFAAAGLSSPQAPRGNERDVAEANGIDAAVMNRAGERLQAFGDRCSFSLLDQAVGGAEALLPNVGCNPVSRESSEQVKQSAQEFSNRQMAIGNALTENAYAPPSFALATSATVGPLVPCWLPGEPATLVFARRVTGSGEPRIQGFVVDWPRLERELLGLIRDLFDAGAARLVRCDRPEVGETAMLASVPARLDARFDGTIPTASLPIGVVLWVSWGVTLLGLGALFVTLRAAIGYGERRARFASAVTHELRTPLTTFRMYSEMLAEGVVRGADAQREYLLTLQRESDRLARVVENVLAWSRLEEGRFASRRERIDVADLLERVVPPLERRLGEASMVLVREPTDADVEGPEVEGVVHTDEDAVGQILFNLVDNAAKYAAGAADQRVHLSVRRTTTHVHLRLCDHGPGIDAAHHERVFAPFDRGSVPSGNNDVPGVGLGLALARGLARDLGGDLRLVPPPAGVGACFELLLPVT